MVLSLLSAILMPLTSQASLPTSSFNEVTISICLLPLLVLEGEMLAYAVNVALRILCEV